MGRIKSKLVKRTAFGLLKEENAFNSEFNNNKSLLKGVSSSKKIRNQIAGYITRLKKAESKGKRIAK
jgi:ribosomal protein S17E